MQNININIPLSVPNKYANQHSIDIMTNYAQYLLSSAFKNIDTDDRLEIYGKLGHAYHNEVDIYKNIIDRATKTLEKYNSTLNEYKELIKLTENFDVTIIHTLDEIKVKANGCLVLKKELIDIKNHIKSWITKNPMTSQDIEKAQSLISEIELILL